MVSSKISTNATYFIYTLKLKIFPYKIRHTSSSSSLCPLSPYFLVLLFLSLLINNPTRLQECPLTQRTCVSLINSKSLTMQEPYPSSTIFALAHVLASNACYLVLSFHMFIILKLKEVLSSFCTQYTIALLRFLGLEQWL